MPEIKPITERWSVLFFVPETALYRCIPGYETDERGSLGEQPSAAGGG